MKRKADDNEAYTPSNKLPAHLKEYIAGSVINSKQDIPIPIKEQLLAGVGSTLEGRADVAAPAWDLEACVENQNQVSNCDHKQTGVHG